MGVVGLVMSGPGEDEPGPPPIVIKNPPPPPPAPKKQAWWDSIPQSNLAALATTLKEGAAEERMIFDAMSVSSDVERYKGYEQLANKLPELVRTPKIREPLAKFVTACCVFEPSELNVAPLRQVLCSQLPNDNAAFRPEEKGADLERAFFWLDIVSGAVNHPAIRPERALSLANELSTAFRFSLDTSAPPAALKVQAEKLLAVRCYRNTLPTAAKSVDHAVTIRAMLVGKVPQHLSAGFRNQVDMDLVALGLAGGKGAWPKLAPILKACLESTDPSIGQRIADVYEQASPELAQQMDKLLAERWKTSANPQLKHADKVAAIRKNLVAAAKTAKISPAQRLAQLQKLTASTLAAVKPGVAREMALLQDTVRLAHASTMACTLFHKDADVERFDDLIARIPEIDQPEPAKTEETKKKDEGPRQPAANGIVVGGKPRVILGTLTRASPRDVVRRGHFCTVYAVSMKARLIYTIDLISTAFDSYLRLEDPRGLPLAEDDDGGGYPNARIVFAAPVDGVHRVIATTFVPGAIGRYTLVIREGNALMGGPGLPPFGPGGPLFGKRPFPGLPELPGPNPEAPEAPAKTDAASDLVDIKLLGSQKSHERAKAFQNLASSTGSNLGARRAQKIAEYLLLTNKQKSELEQVAATLNAFTRCRPVILALADQTWNEKVTQQNAELIIGGVLEQPLRFAQDEDWRSACKKLLLGRALELTASTTTGADQAAEILANLYKEQGQAFGITGGEFLALTRPTLVLQRVVKEVAARTGAQNTAPAGNPKPGQAERLNKEDREYLEQIERNLEAARFVAANDLEHMVLLQRHWIKVLSIYLAQQTPAQARSIREIQQELAVTDRQPRSIIDQLRAGEAGILRAWTLAHNFEK
jgi:hypothetical protein